jgi:hypothetical protein
MTYRHVLYSAIGVHMGSGLAQFAGMQALTFFWLRKGGKYPCFDQHRQFLAPDHEFRRDKKRFKKDVVVDAPPPRVMTGADINDELEGL